MFCSVADCTGKGVEVTVGVAVGSAVAVGIAVGVAVGVPVRAGYSHLLLPAAFASHVKDW